MLAAVSRFCGVEQSSLEQAKVPARQRSRKQI
jgi:hypothetical protein